MKRAPDGVIDGEFKSKPVVVIAWCHKATIAIISTGVV